jgi:VWA domain-containing protein
MGDFSFLTPAAGLLALLVAAPLTALLVLERRARSTRSVLGLPPDARSAAALPALALVACAVLLALAAAQPVLADDRTRAVRSDIEAFFVLDISRSMLARADAGQPTRLERAREAASEVRAAIPEVPVGLVSLTDRPLPHLLPTVDRDAFAGVLRRALDIERPPPRFGFVRVTTYFPLEAFANANYFPADISRRLLVVFTDGESQPYDRVSLGRALRGAGIDVVLVQFWRPSEQVFGRDGRPERYRPDPASRRELEALAATVEGTSFSEDEVGAAIEAVRAAAGDGPRTARSDGRDTLALAPYALVAAFAPLGFLLWRRNRP